MLRRGEELWKMSRPIAFAFKTDKSNCQKSVLLNTQTPSSTNSFVRSSFFFLMQYSTKPPPPLNEEIFSCSENREHLYATDIVESIVSSSNNCFFSGLMRCCLLLCKELFSVFVQNYFCM